MAEETVVVVDHNADLAAAVKEQVEQGKTALAALKTHSNAVHAGSTVHTAIDDFGKVFEKLGKALDLHKQHAKPAEPSAPETPVEAAATGITASEPETHPDGPVTDAVPAGATEATEATEAAKE